MSPKNSYGGNSSFGLCNLNFSRNPRVTFIPVIIFEVSSSPRAQDSWIDGYSQQLDLLDITHGAGLVVFRLVFDCKLIENEFLDVGLSEARRETVSFLRVFFIHTCAAPPPLPYVNRWGMSRVSKRGCVEKCVLVSGRVQQRVGSVDYILSQ